VAAGFELEKLLDIVQGALYHEIPLHYRIIDFEFVPTHLQEGRRRNCFISISKARWEKVHGIETKWIDGNDRILDHVNACDVIIIEEPIQALKEEVIQIIIDDSYQSMQKIAKASHERMENIVIGITGSVGKSSTRLLLEHLVEEEHTVIATRGNHNTQAGVLLFGAKLSSNPNLGILEISLNALNNRGNQAEVIQPDICIVTSIGEAHLTTLLTTEYKARIFAGLKKDGLAIINGDIAPAEFDILYRAVKKRTSRIKIYSESSKDADIYIESVLHKKYTSEINCNYKGEILACNMDLLSKGTIMNAMATLLCLGEIGFDLKACLPKMNSFVSLDRIMELKQFTTLDGRKIDIIDDSHNAAVPSM